MGKQLHAGDVAIRGRLTRYPDFINTVFAQVQGEGGIEDVEPAAHRGQLFQGAGEDLHAAAVANENHDLIALFANGFQQVRQGIVVNAAGQIIADQAESLLAGEVIFSQ